jgi:DNA-binding transcriptional regulator/RsmH inhibitor MraZ
MAKKNKSNSSRPVMESGCCRVEALVSVDERGQVVLPKELREKAGIKALIAPIEDWQEVPMGTRKQMKQNAENSA